MVAAVGEKERRRGAVDAAAACLPRARERELREREGARGRREVGGGEGVAAGG